MFYERFMQLCKRDGVSAAAVAKDIGLSNSVTTYWKKGAVPKYDTLVKLANYFHVSVEYIRGDDMCKLKGYLTAEEFESDWERITGTLHNADGSNSMPSTKAREMLLQSFDRLNPAGQIKAVERVGELVEIPKYKKEPPHDDNLEPL